MAKNNNDIAALLIALLLTIVPLGAVGWWFLQKNGGVQTMLSSLDMTSHGDKTQTDMGDRLSYGERLLLKSDTQPDKLQGIAAYGKGDYAQAQQLFQAALSANRNDPETLIYLNNAKASLSAKPVAHRKADLFEIAMTISMPVDTDTSGAKELLRGVAQAQKEFNERGNALKILIGDDDGDKAIAAELAQAFVNKPEILGVIGHFSSDTSLAAAKVYEAQGLVMISPTSTSVSLSSAGDYIFRTVPSDRFTGNALANHLLNKLKVKKVAIFYNAASDYSNSLKDSLTTDLFSQGGSVVAEIDVNQAGFNPAQALTEIQGKGTQAIALLTNTPTLNQALQVMQVNQNKLPMVAGDSLYKPETLQIGGRDAAGMALAVPWHILSNPNAIFPKTSRALWGGDVNWRTALAYDATEVFIKAIQQTPNLDRKSIQATLANPNFSAPGSAQTIQFLPSGDRNQAVQMVEVKKGNRSGFGYDYVPIP